MPSVSPKGCRTGSTTTGIAMPNTIESTPAPSCWTTTPRPRWSFVGRSGSTRREALFSKFRLCVRPGEVRRSNIPQMPALAGISAPLGAKRHKFIGCKDPRGDLNSRPLGPNDAVRPPFSTMNISVERLPECKARLSAEIPAETVKKTRREIVSTYASQAKVPGFRPGKIPSAVIEKRYADSI